MASSFIGYTVLVTLKSPPNAQIRGTISNVAGQRLTLQDVTLLWSGQRFPTYHIDSPGIADLEVSSVGEPNQGSARLQHVSGTSQAPLTARNPQGQYPPTTGVEASRSVAPVPVPETSQPSFVDPAILSFSKPPGKPGSEVSSTGLTTSVDRLFHSVATARSSDVATTARTVETSREPQRQDSSVTAILTEPFSHVDIHDRGRNEETPRLPSTATAQAIAQAEDSIKQTAKRNRRENRKTGQGNNGWRTSDFVAPIQSKNGRSDHVNNDLGTQSRANRKTRNRKSYAENLNGWATEDATDIQEMGDFDFEGNLSKFDKRKVFDEIRNDDTTADEDRLVSHNKRAARPGTNGGKNLHYTENVLDSPPPVWNSEAGETDAEANEDLVGSGNYSGRDRSKTAPKVQSRKGSGATIQGPTTSQASSITRAQLATSRTASPHPSRPSGAPSTVNGVINASVGSLRLTTTNRSCPTISPLQMLEVEQLAVTELGLSEEIIIENAGRGIAEGVVSQLTSDSAAPTVLVLTANHRTAARAVCAARHLRNRGHRVTVCVVGHDDNALLDNCRKQLEIFKKIGGRVLRWEELSARLATADFSPDFVVDAIFGIHLAFEDFRTDDQASVFEMLTWINRSKLDVLSVDVPSGVSASTGEVSIVQEARLCVTPKYVVCLAAPKTGVMQALISGEGSQWQLFVADIGISQVVWRKYGTRRRHGVDFGNRWVVPLRYQLSEA